MGYVPVMGTGAHVGELSTLTAQETYDSLVTPMTHGLRRLPKMAQFEFGIQARENLNIHLEVTLQVSTLFDGVVGRVKGPCTPHRVTGRSRSGTRMA